MASSNEITNKVHGQHGEVEINLTSRFSQQMAQLCMSNDYSDVTFIVENQALPAHKVILASRSEYFR
jgi:BTB/POZ domain-containing protein 9